MRKRIIGKAHELRCTSVRGIAAKSQSFSAKRTAGRSHIRTQARRGSSQSSRASRNTDFMFAGTWRVYSTPSGALRPRPGELSDPRVPNLVLFLEIGVCVDAARWLVHVARRRLSRGPRTLIRDRGPRRGSGGAHPGGIALMDTDANTGDGIAQQQPSLPRFDGSGQGASRHVSR